MDERIYDRIDARLVRIEEKLDAHIAESGPLQADIRVLQAEMRLIKFICGGFGLAVIALAAESMWPLL